MSLMMLLPLPSSTPTDMPVTTAADKHSPLMTTPQTTPTSVQLSTSLSEPFPKTTYAVSTKATPTEDLSTSDGNNVIQSPVVVIGGSTLGAIFAVSVTTIAIIIIFLLVR